MKVHRMQLMLRWLLLMVLCIFVVLDFYILMNFQPLPSSGLESGYGNVKARINKTEAPHVQIGRSTKESFPPNFFNRTENSMNSSIDYNTLTQIQNEILRINREQKIHNLYKFGLNLNLDSIVIVVQVHNRLDYFKLLLESLKEAKNIENSLLILSHDVYNEEMINIVRNIKFCAVMQIYFPHSLQVHPKVFPGEDPKDCARNMTKEEAAETKCQNAAYPDKHGHYREAKYCQTKHHWFWKLNHIFDNLNVMKNYEGLVLLLEEDYYVTPDVLTVLQMMQILRLKECKDCKILSAGNYDKLQNFPTDSGKVEVANWTSSRHNMGMAFTVDLFRHIKDCAKEFCHFDDYNWDWTLQHISAKCFPNQMKVLKIKATRVFHMGVCGVHHKGKNCQSERKKESVKSLINSNKQYLFPINVTIGGYSDRKLLDPKPNGGWGDLRDRELCLSFVKNDSEV